MKITFIMPAVGRKKGVPYPRSWIMEPLGLAALSALTPPEIERVLYDDRLESIPYEEPTDLAAINVETYTAMRAYQIASRYRERGVTVVMGGYHPTLLPDEVEQHADAIVCGEAEGVWNRLIEDFRAGRLRKRYRASGRSDLAGRFPDRSLFKGKRYFNLTLIETGRGCRFGCEFCSISSFYRHEYTARPVADVVQEISATGARTVFFVDDNIANDRQRAKELFSALIPLRINWVSQVSMHICNDDRLIALMKRSGCRGVLIGFESLEKRNLAAMGKKVNTVADGYDTVVRNFHRHGLAIYATFVFGYGDTERSFRHTYDFAMRNRIFYTAFNHLVPFPGTGLYARLKKEGKLRYDSWWTDPHCRFGNCYFTPDTMSPPDLERLCYRYRYRYFRPGSILYRLLTCLLYWRDPVNLLLFLGVNCTTNRETRIRQMLPFGVYDE